MVIDINLIQKSAEGTFVYVAETNGAGYVAKRREVTTGKIYNGKVEITSGLNSGDKLITSGYQELVDGQNIQYKP